MKRSEIQSLLEIRHRDYFSDQFLNPAIKAGFIEMTIPEKPKSSKQKYRLTDEGKKLKHQLLQEE